MNIITKRDLKRIKKSCSDFVENHTTPMFRENKVRLEEFKSGWLIGAQFEGMYHKRKQGEQKEKRNP